MPKRLLNSVKIKSVHRPIVVKKLTEWADQISRSNKDILRIGYFGSYARDDYTPSSDLDVLIVLKDSNTPPHKRLHDYSIKGFPIGCEFFVFTEEEIEQKGKNEGGWMHTILSEVKWII